MLIYLGALSIAYLMLWFLITLQLPFLIGMYGGVLLPIVLIFAAEFKWPFRRDWLPSKRAVMQDLFYLLGIQVVLVQGFKFVVVGVLLSTSDIQGQVSQLWPQHLPFFGQLLLMIVAGELLQYWWHRACHHYPKLWAIHSVHHQPKSCYSLNTGRFHPLDKLVEYSADILVFIVAGASMELVAYYYVFYAVNGVLQHSNLTIKLGALNHVLASVQNHRLHHDIDESQAHCNYGNNTMIWDQVFGTYRHYSNEVKAVGIDVLAGQSLLSQLLHPLVQWGLLNWIVKLKTRACWQKLLDASCQPAKAQQKVLSAIVQQNRCTKFGQAYGFDKIDNISDFQQQVPIQNFEQVRPWVDQILKGQTQVLTRQEVSYLAKTSATTGQAKYIPATQKTKEQMCTSQKVAVYAAVSQFPAIFTGDAFLLTDRAVEEVHNQIDCGAMSGKVYAHTPGFIKRKSVVPQALGTLANYDVKYRVIAIIALTSPTVTLYSTANPSTIIKLNQVINENRELLAAVMRHRDFTLLDNDPIASKVLTAHLQRTSSDVVEQALNLLEVSRTIGINDYFPHLAVVFCWTKGSCTHLVKQVQDQLPQAAKIVELGYLSSEFRGTVTVDAQRNLCMPLLDDNFYEFIEKEDYENGVRETLLIHQLAPATDYYIIATTYGGLYRYFINDIVRTTQWINQTPTLDFVQKGKGVTNITGEKLSEHQLIGFFTEQPLQPAFFICVCYPKEAVYRLFVEGDIGGMAQSIHAYLCQVNIEYRSKSNSKRLNAMQVLPLQKGTGERYKKQLLNRCGRDAQFKYLHLGYAGQVQYNFEQHTAL